MLPAPGWGVPPILGQCSVQHQYCWVNWKGNWRIKRKKRTFSLIWWGLIAGKTFAAGLLPPCSPTTRAHSQGSKKRRAAKPAAFHGKQQGSLGNQNQLPCKGKKGPNLWFISSVEAWNKLSKCAILQLLFVFHKCSWTSWMWVSQFSYLKIIFRDIHIMLMLWSELKLLWSAGREKLCRSCKYKNIHLIMFLYIKIKQTSAIFVFFNLFFIYCIRLLELD